LSVPKLKILLGIQEDESKEFLAEFAYEQAGDMVKNYCRIDTVPAALENVVLSMAIDLYRSQNLGGEDAATGPVKSISEGDVSVSFGSAASTSDNPAMKFLKDYMAQLDRFRKAGW